MKNEAYKDDQILFDQANNLEGPAAPIADVVEDSARYRVDAVLQEQMEPLPLSIRADRVTRNEVVKKIGSGWAPASKEEAKLLATGLKKNIEELSLYAPLDKAESSMGKRYGRAVAKAMEVARDLEILNDGFGIDSVMGSYPNVRTIKASPAILETMADYFVRRRELDEYKWPHDEQDQKEEKAEVAMWVDYLSHASPETLTHIHRKLVRAKREQYKTWLSEVSEADEHPYIKRQLSDPKTNLPRIRPRLFDALERTNRLLELSDRLEARRHEREVHVPTGVYEVPEEIQQIQELLADPHSGPSVRLAHIEDGFGMSNYQAQLGIPGLGVRSVGLAVPETHEQRQKNLRGVRGRAAERADKPLQKTQDIQAAVKDEKDFLDLPEAQRLINEQGLRDLGAVLYKDDK